LIASETVQRIVSDSGSVTVLPETVISRWKAMEAFWEPTLAELRRQRRLAIIGAGLAIPDSPAYQNAALIIGPEKRSACGAHSEPAPASRFALVGQAQSMSPASGSRS
jgi:hypothetical protein